MCQLPAAIRLRSDEPPLKRQRQPDGDRTHAHQSPISPWRLRKLKSGCCIVLCGDVFGRWCWSGPSRQRGGYDVMELVVQVATLGMTFQRRRLLWFRPPSAGSRPGYDGSCLLLLSLRDYALPPGPAAQGRASNPWGWILGDNDRRQPGYINLHSSYWHSPTMHISLPTCLPALQIAYSFS